MEYGIHGNMVSRIVVDNLAKGKINDLIVEFILGQKLGTMNC